MKLIVAFRNFANASKKRSQPKGVEPKMRWSGLRSFVCWKGTVKQKGVKMWGLKNGYVCTQSAVELIWI
jgi:hypothetical protein